MKSYGVLATLMLAAVAGYASAAGTCGQKTDGSNGGPIVDADCAAVAAAGSVGTAKLESAAATCVGACDMTVAADKTACCTDTPWTTASEAACQHATTGTDSGDADGTAYTWTTGTASADATCVTTCACIAGAGTKATAAAVNMPFYATQDNPGYGYGCEAHDKGQSSQYMGADGNVGGFSGQVDTRCSTDGLDGDVEKNDWCLDQWCIVPKGCLGYKLREVSYTADTDDWFSYEVCEGKKGVADPNDAVGGPGEFKGNGRVGRTECLDYAGSFCSGLGTQFSGGDCDIDPNAVGCCGGERGQTDCKSTSSAAAAAPLAAAVALALFWA